MSAKEKRITYELRDRSTKRSARFAEMRALKARFGVEDEVRRPRGKEGVSQQTGLLVRKEDFGGQEMQLSEGPLLCCLAEGRRGGRRGMQNS